MMSCLYNLHEHIVYDFELVDHNDEQACAINHIKTLKANDLVIFDRGYFSYFMFYTVLQHNVDGVADIILTHLTGETLWKKLKK
jgi:hypothetical protein